MFEQTRTGAFEAADAVAMETAIKAAFDDMDVSYRNPAPPVLGATINDFIGRFCPERSGSGQDMCSRSIRTCCWSGFTGPS